MTWSTERTEMDLQHASSGSVMAPMLDSPSKYGRDQKYVYKKTSYQYSNTDGNRFVNTEQNVNQLDALLEDLKNEREQTREKDIHTSSTSYRTIEPTGTVTKTTRIVKSHQLPTEVENVSEYNSYNSLDRSSTAYKDVIRNDTSTYNTSKTISGNMNTSSKVIETSNVTHSENNVHVPDLLEQDSKNLALSDDILPIPGTKVTTTVRTYTYEIPADHNTINNRTLLYKNNAYNSSRNEFITEPNLPQTVIYSSDSYNTLNGSTNSGAEKLIGPSPTNRVYEINESQEYRTLRNDHLSPQPVPPSTKTIVYNINKTEHNTSSIQGTPLLPQNSPSSYTVLPTRPQQSPHQPTGSTNNYYYRESTNTVNTMHGPPGDNLPPNVTIEYPRDTYPNNPPSTVTYKYSSSTTNSHRGPNYESPTSHPPPFPVDGVIYPEKSGNPPAQLNELLDSFGGDNVDGKLVDTNHRPKREIETALATTNQQTIPSVNKAGRAVYYPPGQEISQKMESSAGGYSASGQYAKASGMYEYESGYKSKSSSKSGAAVVPVCLPLCCAMPCSIM